MMRQYHEAKAACGDALLFFRMGDFYELFFDDAKLAAKVLGLTLTSRDRDSENPTAMAGFPHHQLDAYLQKLIRAGYRAAVCEQVEDPKLAKGLVKREITRVVSAGTLTDDGLLDPRETNYLAAVCLPSSKRASGSDDEGLVGIAWAELSSGRFEAGTFARSRVEDELARIGPAEVIYREDDVRFSPDTTAPWAWTARPAWSFAEDSSRELLCKQFSVHNLEGFGFESDDAPAIRAAGAVLAYLQETQRGDLDHFRSLTAHHRSGFLQIDAATRRSLEITRTLRSGSREGSLLGVIDRTCTPMGSRLLADWIAAPLIDRQAINDRLDAVQELVSDPALRADVRATLKQTFRSDTLARQDRDRPNGTTRFAAGRQDFGGTSQVKVATAGPETQAARLHRSPSAPLPRAARATRKRARR